MKHSTNSIFFSALQKTVIFTIANHQHLENLVECLDIAGPGLNFIVLNFKTCNRQCAPANALAVQLPRFPWSNTIGTLFASEKKLGRLILICLDSYAKKIKGNLQDIARLLLPIIRLFFPRF